MKIAKYDSPLSAAALLVFCLVVWFAATNCHALAPLYHATNLGTLGGNSVAHDINNHGQVVGYSWLADNVTQRAFRTGPNSIINPATDQLGTLGGNHSSANSINDLGQVVGDSYLADNSTLHVFKTAPNAPINPLTDDLGVGPYAQASGINNSGQVVGGRGSSASLRAYRTKPNAAINTSDSLGTLGGTDSVAYAINASGQVAGYSFSVGSNVSSARAIRVAADGVINSGSNLGTLGGQTSTGISINDLGQVAGESWISGNGAIHAYRTMPNAPIDPATDDLGTLPGAIDSRANDINNVGWVVGQASFQFGNRAFLHDGVTMRDLNSLLDSSAAGWTLHVAVAINDRGQIVGQGAFNGATRAFRLDPIPEPATAANAAILTALGLIAFLRARRAARVECEG